jgi:hypothetical protein
MTNYAYLDTDETKFVSIAKSMLNYSNWADIKLNSEHFFDLSPMFFWITNFSCLIFGKICRLAVRLPISLITTAGVIFLFLTLKNILTRTYAMLITLILITCLGFLVFPRLATYDILFVIFTMVSILLTYGAIFQKNKEKSLKYWIGIYVFMSFSILTGGLFGLFIPLISIIAMHIFSGNLKEFFKPKHLITGLFIMAVIVLPWYIIMFNKYGNDFWQGYIQTYNILNHLKLKNILTVFWQFALGFSPWIFSFLCILGKKAKGIVISVVSYFKDNSEDKLKAKWHMLHKTDKFLSLNTIVFFTTLIFALIYGAKHTFLILFLMFPAACLSGHYWYEYIIKKQHTKSIFIATMIPNLLLIILSLVGLFGHNIINTWLFTGLNKLLIPLIVIFFVIPLIGIFSVMVKSKKVPYVANIILMISLSFVITPSVFNFLIQNSGENDLIKFSQLAKADNTKLYAYIPSKKYSLIYYYDNPVSFKNSNEIKQLKTFLKQNPTVYVIVEIKDLWTIEDMKIKYMLLDSGKRYALIQHMPNGIEDLHDTREPKVIIY